MNRQKIILKWLNKEFGNLTKVVRGNLTYYVDKNRLTLFYYYGDGGIEEENRWVYINNKSMWSLLEKIFVMCVSEIKEVMKVWLEITYNLRGRSPQKFY